MEKENIKEKKKESDLSDSKRSDFVISIKDEFKYDDIKEYHDKNWSIFFYIVFTITIGLFIYGLIKYVKDGIPDVYNEENFTEKYINRIYNNKILDYAKNVANFTISFYEMFQSDDDINYNSIMYHNIYIYLTCILIPIILSVLYFSLILRVGGRMMSVTFIFGFIILLFIITVFMVNLYHADLINTNAYLVFIYIAFSISFVYLLIKWRHAIKAAIAIMDIAVNIMKKYKSVIIFSYLNVVIESVINFVFVICFIIVNINQENYDYGKLGVAVVKNAIFDISSMSFLSILITIFLFISYIYNKCVFQYIIYTTTSDVFASRLFNIIEKKEVKEYKVTFISSFVHRVFKCFGSICFGSFFFSILDSINSILEIIKFILCGKILKKIIYNKLNEDGKIKKIIDYSILLPWTAIDFALQYFNEFAFTLLAIKNVSYREAAKKSVEILHTKDSEIEIKKNIIKYIIIIYKVIIYFLSVGITLAVVISLDQTDEEITFYFFFSIATANAVFSCISSVLEASSNTIFICYFGLEDRLNDKNFSQYLHEIDSPTQSNNNICESGKNYLNKSKNNIIKTVEIEDIDEV